MTNTDIRKLTEQEAANTAGGVEGYNYGNGWRTVMNLQGGYLAIRTGPDCGRVRTGHRNEWYAGYLR